MYHRRRFMGTMTEVYLCPTNTRPTTTAFKDGDLMDLKYVHASVPVFHSLIVAYKTLGRGRPTYVWSGSSSLGRLGNILLWAFACILLICLIFRSGVLDSLQKFAKSHSLAFFDDVKIIASTDVNELVLNSIQKGHEDSHVITSTIWSFIP